MAGPELPMEPLGSPAPEPGSPPRSPGPAGDQRRRPAPLRMPGLGYGAFRRPGGPEPPGPAAEPPRDSDSPGPEPGTWSPVELQVDVRVTPVGAQGSRSPSPAPSTRFLTVPVPESPASLRRAAPPFPALAAPPSPLAGSANRPPASPLGRCRCCRDLYPDKKEETALLPRADGTELPRAIALLGLPMYMKSLRWALAIMAILLAVSVVTIIVLIAGAGTRCRLCPEGWMWAEDQCLYLSTETRAWEAGQAFCSAQHATLPLLNHTQSILIRHYMALHSWVGAWHSHQGWHWINGAPMLPQMLWEDKELRCGALEEGKLVALNCTTPRPWVCVRAPK